MKRRIYLHMKSPAEARELFLSRFEVNSMLAPEEIPTVTARGRVTAAPVWARWSSPAAHQAAMDGFAVAAADTYGARPESPRLLAVGREAHPINTGHLMPPGTDAVIMVENVPDPEADPLTIEAPVFPWHNVRRVGEDLVAGPAWGRSLLPTFRWNLTPSFWQAWWKRPVACRRSGPSRLMNQPPSPRW
ncbi:MAG: hypothetical protein P8X58_12795 [Syntrophobacterales bacterium]